MSVWDKLEKLCDRLLRDERADLDKILAEQKRTNRLLGEILAAAGGSAKPASPTIGSLVLGKAIPQ
jgi:hypothetical protein